DYASDAGRETFRQAQDQASTLREAALERFEKLYQRRLPLRLLGIELSPLMLPERLPELFPDPDVERDHRLAACIDAVHHRFGFTALGSGATLFLAQKLDRDRENFRMRTPCLTR